MLNHINIYALEIRPSINNRELLMKQAMLTFYVKYSIIIISGNTLTYIFL